MWKEASTKRIEILYLTNADVSLAVGDGGVGACVDNHAINSADWKAVCGDRACIQRGFKMGWVSEVSPPTTAWSSANKLNCAY